MAKSPEKTKQIDIQQIRMGGVSVWIVGTTPLIMHRFATKAWHELLLPSQTKNRAERAETLKHDPLAEFRGCLYQNRSENEPTLVHFPSGAFSKAIAAAALDIPGASKSQMLRLVSISSEQVNVFGTPVLGMDMVRSSDMNKTPDVRTRPYFPEWACKLDIDYVSTLINQTQIFNLVGAAGLIVGLGDYRPQRGGVFGKFRIAAPDDPALLHILKQDRAVQVAAVREPSFYNDDSAELYSWYCEEVERREKVPPSSHNDGLPQVMAKTVAEAKSKRNGKAAQA
jgi:hypothetical protein